MSTITTHVLDTVLGRPAAGIAVRLDMQQAAGFIPVSSSTTDNDGRCRDLAPDAKEGVYRLTFFTSDYMTRHGRSTIYPEISITFVCGSDPHYHLPLLMSDNSYTTYRGS
jgi:5-hydroxyisourate hydrolase